jgi:hypothetical protein
LSIEKITAHRLAKVSFHGDVKDNAIAMALEDSNGQKMALAVTAQTVGVLLPPLLGLAKEWSQRTDLNLDKVTGAQNSLPADRIEFAKGRNEKEIAVRLFVGEIELPFVMPVEELLTKISTLSKRLKRVSEVRNKVESRPRFANRVKADSA